MPAKSLKINLAPKDEFESSLVGRILKWALTAGKSIVILTEFVVILAFLSRFKLDMDLNDLNEVIVQKQAIVESYADVEKQMRDLQTHLAVLAKANERNIGIRKFADDLAAKMPKEITLESLEVGKGLLSLKGGSSSEVGLAALLNQFKSGGSYNSVNIGEVQFNQRKGLIEFSIAARNIAAPTPTARTPQ